MPIAGDMWEERIMPLLYDLKDYPSIQTFACAIDQAQISVTSNDEALITALRPAERRMGFVPAPQFHFYVFSGFRDLSVLRRFKDFPDETPREDLIAFWIGECADRHSIIILNRDSK